MKTFKTRLILIKSETNFDFIANRKKAYIFSGTIIAIGLALVLIQGLNLGIDFKGGRSYVVTFNKPVEATSMRNSLVESFENSGTEVKNYGSNNVMKITTSYQIEDDSEVGDDKVKNALIQGIQKFSGLTYIENDATVDEQHFTISSSSKEIGRAHV